VTGSTWRIIAGALWRVLVAGEVGAVYNMCGESEIPYIELMRRCWRSWASRTL